MINRSEMARPPNVTPIFTDEEARELIRENIAVVAKAVQGTIRLYGFISRPSRPLFTMSGSETDASLLKQRRIDSYERGSSPVGRVEANHCQDLAFEVMRKFGFDPSISIVEDYKLIKEGWQETVMYPSQTIKGLSFERIVRVLYERSSNKPFHVIWYVRDTAPETRVDVKRLLKRRDNAASQ